MTTIRIRFVLPLLAIAMVGLAASWARATSLPGAQVFLSLNDGTTSSVTPGSSTPSTLSASFCSTTGICLTTSAQAAYISGDAVASMSGVEPNGYVDPLGLPGDVSEGSIQVDASYEVLGPPGYVPLHGTGFAATEATGNAFVTAGASYFGSLGELALTGGSAFFEACSASGISSCGKTSSNAAGTSAVFFAAANNVYLFSIALENGCDGAGPCSYSASVDPSIAIDPSFANASEYSIIFSPGLGPTSTTPEPGSLVLLGTGLLGLAWAVRRKMQVAGR